MRRFAASMWIRLALGTCAALVAGVALGATGIAAGSAVLLLEPELVGLGGADDAARERVGAALTHALRQRLARDGVRVEVIPPSGTATPGVRRAVTEIAGGATPAADERIAAVLERLREGGIDAVVWSQLDLVAAGSDGRGLPLPPGELIPYPEDEPEYALPPRPRVSAGGIVFEVIAVSTRTGRIVFRRRALEPGAEAADVVDAIPTLVRRGVGRLVRR